MRFSTALLILGVVTAATAACTRTNPDYCDEASPCAVGRCDLVSNSCTAEARSCTGDSDCDDPLASICGHAGACVECVDSSTCAGERPICDAGACRRCDHHSDCASDLCTESGACAVPEDVFYVSASIGVDDGSCGTRLTPCRTVAAALAQITPASVRRTIKIWPGTYDERIKLGGSHGATPIHLYGAGPAGAGAVITGGLGGVLIADDGADVAAFDLEFAPQREIDGVVCDGRFGATRLRVKRVAVHGAGVGVRAELCELMAVEESRVQANRGGGILLDRIGTARVTNSLIALNGSAGARAGGVAVNGPVSPESLFAWNTVVRNGAGLVAPGVDCGSASLLAVNNIVWRNLGGGAVEVSGDCVWRHSLIGVGAPEGSGIVSDDPLFVDDRGEQTDFHLRAESPAIGAGDPSFVLEGAVDLDGRQRSSGVAADLGAFAR